MRAVYSRPARLNVGADLFAANVTMLAARFLCN